MKARTKGFLAAVLSAASYGTNPIWGKYLYEYGLTTHTVLVFRFLAAILLLGAYLFWKRQPVTLSKRDGVTLLSLGALFAASSLSLYGAFAKMDAGLACTILFVYPIMVAGLMTLFFREKPSRAIWLALAVTAVGLLLLSSPGEAAVFSWNGFWLSILSAFTYAVYIIIVNQSGIGRLPPIQLTFFAMLPCICCLILHSLLLNTPETAVSWLLPSPVCYALALCNGIFSTIMPLLALAVAVRQIGATNTSIVGALEPVAAVFFGVAIFHEAFTAKIFFGILLILVSVLLVVLNDRNQTAPPQDGKKKCLP